jgi:hypothetical protein
MQVRNSDDYNPGNNGDFHEIDYEWLNAYPTNKSSIWYNVFHEGQPMGEAWEGPETYMPKLLNASSKEQTASKDNNADNSKALPGEVSSSEEMESEAPGPQSFKGWLSSMNFTENSTSTNTYFVYSFNWQKDGVTWYVNNVPMLKRVEGETVSWMWGDEKKR